MGDKSRPSASFTPERIFPEGDDDGAAGGGGDDGIVFGEGSADEGEGAAADNSDGGAEIEEFNVSVFAKKKKKKKKEVDGTHPLHEIRLLLGRQLRTLLPA